MCRVSAVVLKLKKSLMVALDCQRFRFFKSHFFSLHNRIIQALTIERALSHSFQNQKPLPRLASSGLTATLHGGLSSWRVPHMHFYKAQAEGLGLTPGP
jgi:hypothetical protein